MTTPTLNPFLSDADAAFSRESAQALFAQLNRQARLAHITLRAPPPEPTTCCGRGCNGCVWEGYFAAVAFWQEDALLAIAHVAPSNPEPLKEATHAKAQH